MRYFYLSWSLIWAACSYFCFVLSSYGQDLMSNTYWKGVSLYFRFPWEKMKEGEKFPHGFRVVTDELTSEAQQLSLGRQYDS